MNSGRVIPCAVRSSAASPVDGAALDPENKVEAVARIIDPHPFSRGEHYTPDSDKYRRRAAIDKARRAIAYLSAQARRPEEQPDLSTEQVAALEAVKALTTAEALELLSLYQQIQNPQHREAVRRLARILARDQAGATSQGKNSND